MSKSNSTACQSTTAAWDQALRRLLEMTVNQFLFPVLNSNFFFHRVYKNKVGVKLQVQANKDAEQIF